MLLLLCLMLILLEFQLQLFPPTYQVFAIFMLRFDLFLQNLSLPSLLSLLFLLINHMCVPKLLQYHLLHHIKKNLHLVLLLSLILIRSENVSSHPVTTLFIFHQIRPLSELPPFFFSSCFLILWLVLFIL